MTTVRSTPRIVRGRAGAVALAVSLLAAPTAAFDLQGHRGARGLAPENTLPAFARALSIGVTTLELDVGMTRDDVLVVAHDPVLNPDLVREPGGAWLAAKGPTIRSLVYEELRRYDVGRLKPGTDYARRYPAQVAVDGTPIPRLVDVFTLARKAGNERVRFNVEIKTDPRTPAETAGPDEFARAVVAEIDKAGMAARTSIQSFDWRTLAVVQKIAPQIPTVYLTAQQKWLDNIGAAQAAPSPWTAGVRFADHGSVPKMVRAAGGRIWSPFFGDLDAGKLAEAKSLGLQVVVWTVNNPADMRRMLDLGVDGIISDRPDLVREVAAERRIALPQPTPVQP
jgi:glycerophosphoryl diester phosphodiesterase